MNFDDVKTLEDARAMVGKKVSRIMPLDRSAIDEQTRTVRIAFSSEFLVERAYGYELLDHSPGSVDLTRVPGGMAFLLNHNTDDQVGVIEEVSIDPDKVGRATVRLSQTREDIWTDIKDSIRRNISVGLEIGKVLEEFIAPDGKPVLRFAWAPIEISLVAVPADYTVGVGRSLEPSVVPPEGEPAVPEGTPPEGDVPKTDAPGPDTQDRIAIITPQMEKPVMDEAIKAERARVAKIEELSSKYAGRVNDMNALRTKAVTEGLSEAEFRGLVLENVKDSIPLETPKSELGLTGKETKKFSIMNAIRAQIPGSKVDASFEREVSDGIAKKLGKDPRGFYVPYEVQRDWNITQTVQGGNLVATDFRPGSFIEMLRNKTFFAQAGVNYLPGLVGNVAIPRQNGAGLAYWCTEAGAPTEQSGSIDQVTLSPKTIGAFQDYTRLMMLQASPAIEGIVRNDILNIISLGVEKALLHGSGSSNQPQGLQYNTTVTASALLAGMAGFNQTSSTDLEAVVSGDSNYSGNFVYIMRPKFAVTLKSRPQIGTTYPVYVIGQDGNMNGYPVLKTNNVESGYVFIGDFSQAWLGEWGTLDITVDPYANSTIGGTRVIGLYNVDVAFRHPEAFTFGLPCS